MLCGRLSVVLSEDLLDLAHRILPVGHSVADRASVLKDLVVVAALVGVVAEKVHLVDAVSSEELQADCRMRNSETQKNGEATITVRQRQMQVSKQLKMIMRRGINEQMKKKVSK